MKALIFSKYYWPEGFRINEVAKSLRTRGIEVEVLTGKPNYPRGEIFAGYRGRVAPASVVWVTKGLYTIFKNKERIHSASVKLKSIVERIFSWEVVVQECWKLYDRLFNGVPNEDK